jgi:hypothetical protein
MTGLGVGTPQSMAKPAIHMECEACKSPQTFRMVNEYQESGTAPHGDLAGQVCRLKYGCSHCQTYFRYFLVAFDHERKWVMKVGQFPAWDIAGDPDIERMLGEHAGYYKKGLICESQGYGIGAFGYYRRIVEETIGSLLADVSGLLSGDELTKYQNALEETKKTIVTQEKIELVKDLLPPILRPESMNPLSVLHSALSEGLHAQSDDECLTYAESVKTVLIFLVSQLAMNREAKKQFTAGMQKLLERKSKASQDRP